MDKTIMVQSGRNFTSEDIDLIKWTRKKYPQLSRKELAATVCEFLDWTTPAGRAKIPQCRSFLETLEEAGFIELPAAIMMAEKSTWNVRIPDFTIDTTPITGELKDIEPIQLEIASRYRLKTLRCGPFIKTSRDNGWDDMLVFKEGSIKDAWREAIGLIRLTPENITKRHCGGRNQVYRRINDVEYIYDTNGRCKALLHVVVCIKN